MIRASESVASPSEAGNGLLCDLTCENLSITLGCGSFEHLLVESVHSVVVTLARICEFSCFYCHGVVYFVNFIKLSMLVFKKKSFSLLR